MKMRSRHTVTQSLTQGELLRQDPKENQYRHGQGHGIVAGMESGFLLASPSSPHLEHNM